MKAEIGGVKIEGTPHEIAEVVKLVGELQTVQTVRIEYVPVERNDKWYPPGPYPWLPTYGPSVTGGHPCGAFIQV